MKTTKKPVGLTKDAGWQMGLRKTLPVPFERAWEFMFSGEGLALWLGKTKAFSGAAGEEYTTSDGITGKVGVFKPMSHIRMTWKKKDWSNTSTLQVRVMQANEKTTISFHHEKLQNEKQRGEMLLYWQNVMARIEQELVGT